MEESQESQEATLSFLSELTHLFSNQFGIQMKILFLSLAQTLCELYVVRISVNSDCRKVKATGSSAVKMLASNMCYFWSYAIFSPVGNQHSNLIISIVLFYLGRLNSQSSFFNDECHSQCAYVINCSCSHHSFLNVEKGFSKQNFREQICISQDDPYAYQCLPTKLQSNVLEKQLQKGS